MLSQLKIKRDIVFSHTTALKLLGIEIPRIREASLALGKLHISVPSKSLRPSIQQVQPHLWAHEVMVATVLHTLKCVPPVVAWEQMAPWVSLVELVALGDSIMRRDRHLKRAKLDDFARQLLKDQNFAGRVKCLRALPLMREDTDSSQETRLRLKMEMSGFKDAVINLKMTDLVADRFYYLDIAYPQHNFSLEYHGAHHGLHQQWKTDIRKQRFLDRVGWKEFQVCAEDLKNEAEWNTLLAAIIAKVGLPQ